MEFSGFLTRCRSVVEERGELVDHAPTGAMASAIEPLAGALAGVRVLELASGLAGPYATWLLCDQGADVVKVECPPTPEAEEGGDWYRAFPGFETLGRGKRSTVIDITTPTGAAQLAAMIPSFDAVVVDVTQAEAAAATDSGGLDYSYEALAAIHPRIVYVAVPPFGSDTSVVDSLRISSAARKHASPALLSAVTGMMHTQISATGEPVYHVLPLVSYGTGVQAALAVVAGLVAERRCGPDAPTADAPAHDDGLTAKKAGAPSPFLAYEVSQLAGSMALLHSADRKMLVKHPMGAVGPIACYRCFEAGDGQWFFLACANEGFFRRMLRAVGLEHLESDPRLKDAWVFTNQEPGPRELLVPTLEATFRSQPRAHWIKVFDDADVPVQIVQSRDAFRESRFVAANKMRVRVEHPTHGFVDMIGVPVALQNTPGRVRCRAPTLGEHTGHVEPLPIADSVKASIDAFPAPPSPAPRTLGGAGGDAPASADSGGEVDGDRAAEVARWPANEASIDGPLAGIRVLDLSSYIAGPLGPRHLAALGADVIKVESPGGDAFRSHAGFGDFNQGKRSVVINLKTKEGKALLRSFVRHADVVVENFRPAVSARIGVDYDTLKLVNPRLIYLSAPGFGSYMEIAHKPAFDPLLQSLSGAVLAQGGGKEPSLHTIPLNDAMTAALSAFGVATALYHRERTGEGQRVLCSLTATSLAIQAAEFTVYDDAPEPPLGGPAFAGPSATERWYATADDKRLFVDAGDAATRATLLRVVLGADSKPDAEEDEVTEALRGAFSRKVLDEWLAMLGDAGVPAAAITPCNAQWELEGLRLAGITAPQATLEGEGHVAPKLGALLRPLVEVAAAPPRVPHRAPKFAEHTHAALSAAGLSDEDIRGLVACNGVKEA